MLKKRGLRSCYLKRKRRGKRSQTGGDVIMEGASDRERIEEDYDGLVS